MAAASTRKNTPLTSAFSARRRQLSIEAHFIFNIAIDFAALRADHLG
jgi:hypothetical protein